MTAVIVAIIAAIASIAAAVIAARKPPKKEGSDDGNSIVRVKQIKGGRDVVVAGRDATLVQHGDPFITDEGIKAISKASRELVPDKTLRLGWNGFDATFLEACVRRIPRGWIFDGAAFQPFLAWDNDEMFNLGFRIYNRAAIELGTDHPDCERIAKQAEIYLTARYMMRGISIRGHPEKSEQMDDYSSLWNGKEEGWSVLTPLSDNDHSSPIIYNDKIKAILKIHNTHMLQLIVNKMVKEGCPQIKGSL
jgi:hypothetical protein